ncbi:MAG: hypothetical protein AB7P97_20890 [Hyphomonadaceae bacterium]
MSSKKKTARAIAGKPKPTEVGLIQPWSDGNDERMLLDHISDLCLVMDSDRYRIEDTVVCNGETCPPPIPFEAAVKELQRAIVKALWTVTGEDEWVIRLRVDAWKRDEPEVEDADVELIAAERPREPIRVKAVRIA